MSSTDLLGFSRLGCLSGGCTALNGIVSVRRALKDFSCLRVQKGVPLLGVRQYWLNSSNAVTRDMRLAGLLRKRREAPVMHSHNHEVAVSGGPGRPYQNGHGQPMLTKIAQDEAVSPLGG